MNNNILVSVICTAYNHEDYIRQALESFVMQKTNFRFEVLVNDDASTDDTVKIIKEYEERYPEIIFPVYQEKNLYSQGIDPTRILIEKSRGKYIAICEGDDYWTDENKLQMQFDVLESHPECVACVHNVDVDAETNAYWPKFVQLQDKILDRDFLIEETRLAHTCSYFFNRKIIDNMTETQKEDFWPMKANGDVKLSAVIVCNGSYYHIAKTMGCYRCMVSHGDSWTARTYGKNMFLVIYEMFEWLQEFCKKYYDIELSYQVALDDYIYTALILAVKHPNKTNFDIAKALLKKGNYPFVKILKRFLGNKIRKLKK